MCGVVGYIGNTPDAAKRAMNILEELQNRGMTSSGAAAIVEGEGIVPRTKKGSVKSLLPRLEWDELIGNAAIGHIRYATSGYLEDAQPLVRRIAGQKIALGVNGDTVNIDGKSVAEFKESIPIAWSADSDTEALIQHVARTPGADLVDRLVSAFSQVEGAWSLLALLGDGRLLAMRDPWGFRPLWFGQGRDFFVFASEDSAFLSADRAFPSALDETREVHPGEIICIDAGLRPQAWQYLAAAERLRACSFESVYLKNPASQGVFDFRRGCGITLAREMQEHGLVPKDIDWVVPMLDSGRDFANSFAHCLGLEVACVINRTRWSEDIRVFLGSSPLERLKLAAKKHVPNRKALRGKRIVLVEDSILRAETLRVVISQLREIAVREVHVVVGSPPVQGPCFYGIAIPTRQELVAANQSVPEIREFIGADSLYYLSLAGYRENFQHLSIDGFKPSLLAGVDVCDACMSGDYPPFVPAGFTAMARAG